VPPEEVVEVALERLSMQPSVLSDWLGWLRANLAVRLGSRPLVAYAARDFMVSRTPADMQ